MKLIFISDLHLAHDTPEKNQLFYALLKNWRGKVDALYILGDFFDYWLGDDDDNQFIREIKSALCEFSQITPIYFRGGNHDFAVGKQFAQETRIAFLSTLGFSETAFGPYGLILAEAHIEYLNELFDEEILTIDLSITAPTRVAFECYYQIKTSRAGKEIKTANIRTNMVCFDYTERKVKSIPEDIKQLLAAKSQG